jgi:phospholipid/cholesterol/gamma-HCH transport system substrate-binding protein
VPVSEKRNELAVGIFLFIGMVLLGGLIIQFGRFEDYFSGQYKITVVFDDASGLIKGSDVRMGGARIGRVSKLPALTEAVQVEVELAINKDTHIPVGSTFQIESATLLGDKLVVVIPPERMTGAFIEPGSSHRGTAPAGIGELQSQAAVLSRDVGRILSKVENTMGKIDLAVGEIQAASMQLNESLAKVNRSVLAEDNLTRFDTTISNLADITAEWKQSSVKLSPTLDEARAAIAAIKSAADKTDAAIAELKPALEGVPAAVGNISTAAKKAGNVIDRIDEGKGLLGTVAHDEEVSTDAKVFINNLRRYGILRYRNQPMTPEEDPRNRFRGKRR